MDRRTLLKAGALGGAALIVPAIAAQLVAPGDTEGLSADFATGRYSGEGFAANLRFSRDSTKTDLLPSSPPGTSYRVFKPGEPAITPGKGILIEEAREQFLTRPDKPAAQSATLATPGVYTLWVNGKGNATVSAGTAVLAGAGSAGQADPLVFRVVAAGTVKIAVSGALHAFQLEKGPVGTSFIPQKGERAPDSLVPVGPLAKLLTGDTGIVMIAATSTDATDPYAGLLRMGTNVLGLDFYDGGIFGNDDASTHPKSASVGIGRFRDGASALIAWTPTGRRLVAGGGVVSRGAPLKVNNATSYAIGANGKDCWNGYIRRLDAWPQSREDAQLRAMTAPSAKPDIVMMGDSLTARNEGEPDGLSVPARVGRLLGKTVVNGGVGGESSAQIAKRYANSPDLWSLPLVIWAGRNNLDDGEQVQQDIADIVSRNRSGKVLILAEINGQLPGEEQGGGKYGGRIAINQALAARYGKSFVDVQAALVAAYDRSNPVDLLDRSVDRVPYSLRATSDGDGVRYYLPSAIDASATAFETSGTARSNSVMKIGDEYVFVESAKGQRVESAVRGYGKGGKAAEHPAYSGYARTDPVHLNDRGRGVVAKTVADRIKALGW